MGVVTGGYGGYEPLGLSRDKIGKDRGRDY